MDINPAPIREKIEQPNGSMRQSWAHWFQEVYQILAGKKQSLVNADTVDNFHASQTPTGDTAVVSESGGKINYGWIPAMSQNDVTSSRALGTIYQNTTGKPMFVSVSAYSSAATIYYAEIDSSATPTTRVLRVDTSVNLYAAIFFVVLPNDYYKVDFSTGAKTLGYWFEWY